ncbi:MAG: TolC family protein, partial [Bacteroidales bacterium]
MLKFYNADILINELKVKSEKRDWMRHLGVEAGVKYGLLDNVVFSSYFGANMNNFNSETRYSIGAYLRIPIGSVLDKSAVKMSEQEIVKAEQLFERTLQELRQLVIIQYNNLIKSHRSLIVRSNLVATYEAQMLRAEKDFTEGNIDVSEYARLNEMYTTSILNLEENKVEFNTALQILQETVGVKIDIND